MKRVLLTIVVLLVAGSFVNGQQAGLPTSAQTKQSAQQSLSQSKTNGSQFESTLNDLMARNGSNVDAYNYNRLMAEINDLESRITAEETRVGNSLDRGTKVSPELLDRIQRLIDQHKAKMAELESFISG